MTEPHYSPVPGHPGSSAAPPPPQPPKKKRTLMWVLIGVAVLILVLIGGCAALIGKAASDVASGIPTEAQASTEPASPPSDSATDEPSDEPTDSATEDSSDDGAEAKIGQTLTYSDGLEVTIAKHRQRKISDVAAGGHPGEPLTIITVKITNNSPHNIDGDMVSVEASYGPDGDPADDVFDTQVKDSLSGTVTKKHSKSGEYGFAIPKKYLKDVTFEVTTDYDHEAAIFTGSVN